jgi:hypothetical protein
MSEENTQDIAGRDERSFEERVFARFDAQGVMLRDLDTRLQRLEARSYDTKPIWEQALKEIADTRKELVATSDEAPGSHRERHLRDAVGLARPGGPRRKARSQAHAVATAAPSILRALRGRQTIPTRSKNFPAVFRMTAPGRRGCDRLRRDAG